MTQPTPVERARLLGNPGKRPLPEPQTYLEPTLAIPPVPERLGTTGQEVWQRVWTAGSQWISKDTDIALMERYCEAYDLREQMRAVVAEEGLTIIGSTGSRIAHPLLRHISDLETKLTKYEGLLGLTPADRARLGLAEIRKANEVERFLANTKQAPKRERLDDSE